MSNKGSDVDDIVHFVRAEKANQQCLFQPRNLLLDAEYIPDSRKNPGAGVWAKINEKSKFGFTVTGELDFTISKYGDTTVAAHFAYTDGQIAQNVNDALKTQFTNLEQLQTWHKTMLTDSGNNLSKIRVYDAITNTPKSLLLKFVTKPIWSKDQEETTEYVSLFNWLDSDNRYKTIHNSTKRNVVQNHDIQILDKFENPVPPKHYANMLCAGDWVIIDCEMRTWHITKGADTKQHSLIYEVQANRIIVLNKVYDPEQFDFKDDRKRPAPDDPETEATSTDLEPPANKRFASMPKPSSTPTSFTPAASQTNSPMYEKSDPMIGVASTSSGPSQRELRSQK